MRPFLHDRLATIERLLERSTAAMHAYTALDLSLPDIIVTFLDEAATAYQSLGRTEAETEARTFAYAYAPVDVIAPSKLGKGG